MTLVRSSMYERRHKVSIRAQDVFVPKEMLPSVNVEALDFALREACPHCHGVSTGSLGVVVHFDYNATVDEKETARQICLAHDPARLHPDRERQRQREQARQAVIEEIRKRGDDPLFAALAAFFEE